MKDEKDGGPAFPRQNNVLPYEEDGMTLRDYFAAAAMQALVSIQQGNNPTSGSVQAYAWADAMLETRNKQ